MGDEKIKSALELAMEKIAKMSELTSEEVIELKEKEYKPRGEAIANKYLGNALRGADLETELDKYQGKEREIVRKALLLTLCQSIELDDVEKSRRAMEGIQTLEKSARLEEVRREIEGVSSGFHHQRQEKYTRLEELERGKLKRLWLSGSAVKPSLKENADWQRELKGIQAIYDVRISNLKEKLSQYLESSVQQ